MTRFYRLCLIVPLLFVLVLTNLQVVEAARGAPGSAEFGFGAILYPDGSSIKEAMSMAAELELDWISVPISWKAYQNSPNALVNTEKLDEIMRAAAQNQMAVLVSITNPPAWAQTPQGPDAALAAQFALALYQRYPQAIRAIELFPGANTQAGWGGAPNPQAYMALFKQVSDQMAGVSAPVTLVAAGLRPLAIPPDAGDMDDLAFLKGLYAAGAAERVKVISIQYGELTGEALAFPDGTEHRILRHYEEIRKEMVTNNHPKGTIWITRLSPPSGKIKASDSVYRDNKMQANWMSQIYIQTRSQLYIGVTFAQSLNPGLEGEAAGVPSLRQADGTNHPFYALLHEMIRLNQSGDMIDKPGRSKEGSLLKKRP